jgi:hypothetical protein
VLRGTPTETQPVLIERDPVLESLIDAQMVSPQPVVEPTATIVPPHPVRRIESPPPRSRVLLGALIVVGVSVAIPMIGWLLPEPTPPPSTAARAPTVVETADLGRAAKSEAKSVAPPSELGPAAAPVDTELLGPFPVQVNATPWARVRVDGIDFGETPLANIPLLAGPHTFHVQMSDGRVIERIVEIDAEQRFVSFE